MSQNKVSKFLIILALLILIVSSIYFAFGKKEVNAPIQNQTEQTSLKIASKTISVEIMRTPAELRQGLSGRESLAENTGMYFELGKESVATFWMKDMKFPIDIIWINNGVIIGVERNAPVPTDTTPTFTSPAEVTNVLEVPAGFFDTNNLQIGDKVTLE